MLQGDPLSPLLYVLAIEPLVHRLYEQLTGATLSDVSWKIGAFADDLVVVLSGEMDEEILVDLIEQFEQMSGVKLNWHKCITLELTGMHVLAVVEDWNGEVWSTVVQGNSAVWYLGIWFSCYGTLLPQEWWVKKLEEMERKLMGWSWLHLSLMGKVLVLNTFWLPKLWYLARQVAFPMWVVSRLEKLMKGWPW